MPTPFSMNINMDRDQETEPAEKQPQNYPFSVFSSSSSAQLNGQCEQHMGGAGGVQGNPPPGVISSRLDQCKVLVAPHAQSEQVQGPLPAPALSIRISLLLQSAQVLTDSFPEERKSL